MIDDECGPSCEGKVGVKTKTILVVDDNPFIAGLLEDLLTNVPGYHVLTIDDGEAAHDLIVAKPPDLIILDVHIPRMNGFALYDELRRNSATATVPILLMSAAMPHPELARRGILDYIRKPFDVEDLLARIHTMLHPPETIH
jgi:DNA-binding response OmpR family regulator